MPSVITALILIGILALVVFALVMVHKRDQRRSAKESKESV